MCNSNPISLATFLFPVVLTGCIGQPLLGPLLARDRSFVRDEQMTEIGWLDAAAMSEPPSGIDASEWTAHVERECPGLLDTDRPKFLPGLLLPLAPLAAAFTIDAVTRQLRAEFKLYAAQFTASATTTEANRFVGFELRRTARGFGDDRPACTMRFAIWQSKANSARLLLIRPLYFRTRAARAKLLVFDHALDTQIDLGLQGQSLGPAGRFVDSTVAVGSMQISDYDLAASRPLLLRGQTLAIVAAPLPDVLTATVAVTERDASHADETFEQLSTLLTRRRTALIAAATQPISR